MRACGRFAILLLLMLLVPMLLAVTSRQSGWEDARAAAPPAGSSGAASGAAVPAGAPGVPAAAGSESKTKHSRTYYTDERIATGRKNVARYEWAQEIRRRIFETGDSIRYYIGPEYTAADRFVEQSDDFLWLLQPTTRIPRVVFPQAAVARCPVHGDEVKRIDPWCPWRIDPIAHPYQIQCPIGKEWYPSSHFERGDTTSGPYPDGGGGFVRQGVRYFPLREYCHMVYGSVVVPTLNSLTQAYVLSGDPRYAHKAAVLLARVASEYPNYGWDGDDTHLVNRISRTYLGPWNNTHPYYTWKHGGMITDCIWEAECIDQLAYAYDALYDWLVQDPDLIRYVSGRGLPVRDGQDLRRYIENYVLRAGMRAVLQKWIWGNEGHHQSAAMALALVLNDDSERRPNSIDMAGYAWYGLGQAAWLMTNGLTRDGAGYETPSYNMYNLRFVQVGRNMDSLRRLHPADFSEDVFPDIFAGPKPRALFDYYVDIRLQDRMFPSIGDEGAIGPPLRLKRAPVPQLAQADLFALQHWPDARFARAATDSAGRIVSGDLWEPVPEERIKSLLAKPQDDRGPSSRFLDGYGVMLLETGTEEARTSAWLNYTSLRGHRQLDFLSIGLLDRGLDLLPDLGYPRSWDYRAQWEANSLAHNTVTVDETQPDLRGIRGTGRIFAGQDGVQLAVASHDPYPFGLHAGASPVDVYERGLLLVDAGESDPYLVDLFLVRGGEQQDQSWHGMMVPMESPELGWAAQAGGTLAGPEVKEFAGYTDRWSRKHEQGDFPSYLSGIRRARLDHPSRWRWRSGLPEGDLFDLTLVPLGGPLEVIEGHGRAPTWKSDSLDYLIVRRQARAPELVRFLTVLSPGRGTPVVDSVRLVSDDPLVLEIGRHGLTDRIELSVAPEAGGKPGITGAMVTLGGPGGETRTVRIGGQVKGAISSVDRERNTLTCKWSPELEQCLQPGQTLRVYNRQRSSLWRVAEAIHDGDRLRIRPDRTALEAIGALEDAQDGVMHLSGSLPFATSAVADGSLRIRQDAYQGMTAECGAMRQRVKAATQDGLVFLVKPVPAAELRAAAGQGTVGIYEYGPGDSLEAVRVSSSQSQRSKP